MYSNNSLPYSQTWLYGEATETQHLKLSKIRGCWREKKSSVVELRVFLWVVSIASKTIWEASMWDNVYNYDAQWGGKKYWNKRVIDAEEELTEWIGQWLESLTHLACFVLAQWDLREDM